MERVLGGSRGPGGAAIDGAAPVTEGIREVVLYLGGVGEGRGGV